MIPAEHPHLYVAAITHPGMKGKDNEDRYAIAAHYLGETDRTPSLLIVVADGVGGHRAGEIASQIAVEKIVQVVGASNGKSPQEVLRQAINLASLAILESAAEDDNRQGMGATCVCAWMVGERLYACWMGDSRLYLVREDAIWQVTTDHTWIQEALTHGILTPDQVAGHPNAHVIHRHLGSQNNNDADFRLRVRPGKEEGSEANQGFRLQPRDRLVLCTDGLTDLVTPEEIHKAVTSYPREQALQGLVNLANARGGHDNITITLAEVPETLIPPDAPAAKGRLTSLHLSLTCLALVVLAFLMFVAVALVWWFFFRTVPVLLPSQQFLLFRQFILN
jgi:protein phosphatase